VTGNIGGNVTDDAGSTGQWMTYGEIAAARGTSRIAAVRLVQRHKWRRQAGNDGKARALVPPDMVQPERVIPPDVASNTAGDVTGHDQLLAGAIAALEDAVQVLREQLERSEAGRADERQRADRAESARTELRGQLEALNTQLAQAQAAVQGADELRAMDDARKAMSRWARAWGAWRGR
jgi:hypothetical protein